MVAEYNLCSTKRQVLEQIGELFMGLLVTADSVHSGSFARICCLLLCLLFVLTVSCSCFRKILQWGKLGIVASYERYIVSK